MIDVACPDEGTLVAFLEGRLGGAALADLDAHLATCGACRDLLAAAAPAVLAQGSRLAAAAATRATVVAAAPAPSALLSRGATVGRYVTLGLVGRGGMGAVYAAYDPELDRKIALKLLNDGAAGPPSRERSRGRLLKEAKAIARLSHPNVVVVHDAGTIDDRVFIAMEYVEGQTLATWLGGRPRPWVEIRAAFLAAGRGLAAAHAARIVHRDFKPQNVMVAADGSVRVMDFGLASDAGAAADDGPASPADIDHSDFSSTVAVGMTRTGSLVGTPAYMAPEQFRGERADPRTDEFSFCVSLYEALHGERPFAADSLPALVQAVSSGRLREPPQRVRVPGWLRKVLLRGLAVKREDRFPAMDDLLAALARDPARRRRGALLAVGLGGLLLAGGAVGQRALQGSGAALCRNPVARLAGAWELPTADPKAPHPHRDAVRAAFLATGAPRAPDIWERTAAVLDGYASRWSAAYADACEATHVRGEQSAEVLDLRMDCLNRDRDSLRALTDVLAGADADVVSHAIDATNALPDIVRCSDVAVLQRAVVPPPRDPALRQRVESLRKRAAEGRALGDAGRWKDGIAKALPLRDEAVALGYEPVVAELESLLAWLHQMLGEAAQAADEAERALWAAEATRHDEVAAEAAVTLVGVVGYDLAKPADGQRWARFADAIFKRMGPGHERLRGWLAQNRGAIWNRTLDLTRAESEFRAAIALKRKADGGDSADVAQSMNGLAECLASRGQFAAAVELNDQTLAIFDRVYGAGNIMSAREHSNRCEYLDALGRYREALDSCRQGLAGLEAAVGHDHKWLAYPLTASAIALIELHRPAEALAPLRRALDIRKRLEPSPGERGDTWFALARAQWDTGEPVASREAARAAREEYAKTSAGADRLRTVEAWLAAHPARAARR